MILVLLFNLIFINQCLSECDNMNCILQEINQTGCEDDLGCTDTSWRTHYDFIIVGGGTAGCVLANRLSANPNWNVLLLEAGVRETIYSEIPMVAPMLRHTHYAWDYETEPQLSSCLAMKNKRCLLGGGKALGGSSVINGMVYTRALKSDVDEWEKMGNYGWSFDQLQPFIKKVENFNIPDVIKEGLVGVRGEVRIERVGNQLKVIDDVIKAGTELGENITSPNVKNILGFSYVEQTRKNGTRFSAARAYVNPVEYRKNLHISLLSTVNKIIIDTNTRTAIGVEYKSEFGYSIAFATKEVILSAGALSSPKLLMLSGIGPKSQLQTLKIPVVMNLPVGEKFVDHVSFLVAMVTDDKSILGNINLNDSQIFSDYFDHRKGPLLWSGYDALSFHKTSGNSRGDDPDVELLFMPLEFSRSALTALKNSFNLAEESFNDYLMPLQGKFGMQVYVILSKPKSSGYVKLKSRDPQQNLAIHLGLLSNPEDVKVMIRGVRKAMELFEQQALKKYKFKVHDTKFPDCEYLDFNTDEFWECTIRHIAVSGYHFVSTCKMGPEHDPESVVDPELRVRGIKNLRVVDNSVAPTIPRGHTMAVAYMIGEKGADMIKKHWT